MSIYYRLDEQNDNLHPEGSKKRGLYPRVISKQTVSLAELSQKAAEGTTFNAFEVEVVGKLIVEQIKSELEDGNNVCIDDFGTFSISAEAIRPAQYEHEIRAESIRVKKILFKTSQRMMKEYGRFKFQRKPKI